MGALAHFGLGAGATLFALLFAPFMFAPFFMFAASAFALFMFATPVFALVMIIGPRGQWSHDNGRGHQAKESAA